MSRVGNRPIQLPKNVTVELLDGEVRVKGPKGQLSQRVVDHVSVAVEGTELTVSRANDSKPAKANHGLMRALIANMVRGTTQGFQKNLEILGVGYRADVKGKTLVMNLGYSHPVEYAIPDGIEVAVDKNTKISVKGIDRQMVGHVAAKIRSFRRPDRYKGKGVRYEGEHVSLKAGKTA